MIYVLGNKTSFRNIIASITSTVFILDGLDIVLRPFVIFEYLDDRFIVVIFERICQWYCVWVGLN